MRNSRIVLTVATMAALAGGAAPAAAQRLDRPAAVPPLRVPQPVDRQSAQITVTRPAGFAWADALIGAGAAALAIALVAGAVGLRRRATVFDPVAR